MKGVTVTTAETDACEWRSLGAAGLVLTFVNSRPNGLGQPELLADGDALTGWLRDRALLSDGRAATDSDAVAARELREALAVLLRAHVGPTEPSEVVDAETRLRDAGERYPVAVRIDAGGASLRAVQEGVPGAFGTLLATVADLAARGQWARLKMCGNAGCHASFLDRTKNQAGRFCSSACSSQVAMRAYRGRLKAT